MRKEISVKLLVDARRAAREGGSSREPGFVAAAPPSKLLRRHVMPIGPGGMAPTKPLMNPHARAIGKVAITFGWSQRPVTTVFRARATGVHV